MRREPLILLLALAPFSAVAQQASTQAASKLPNPVVMLIVLGGLALAPFVLVMLTSFVKISVVLSILRNALGTQSVPPNQVITGLAFILSLFVMTPVVRSMYQEAGAIGNTRDIFSEASVRNIFDAVAKGKEPLRQFLTKHAHQQDRLLFMNLAARLDQSNRVPAAAANQPNPAARSNVSPGNDDFQVVVPAFVTSQLKEAFQAGFLIFLPFIVIDMVVANVLLAMGMNMLSPSVISLPFKILLFVLVDGWFLVVRGLVLSYA
ncbi:MAG: type III secretion system export apparatus subunit SctR [Acidobacteriaceae bacterium]|nr:type III secretion system export apparatus subunit SctR [Acidobacteriaceae bacterium]